MECSHTNNSNNIIFCDGCFRHRQWNHKGIRCVLSVIKQWIRTRDFSPQLVWLWSAERNAFSYILWHCECVHTNSVDLFVLPQTKGLRSCRSYQKPRATLQNSCGHFVPHYISAIVCVDFKCHNTYNKASQSGSVQMELCCSTHHLSDVTSVDK